MISPLLCAMNEHRRERPLGRSPLLHAHCVMRGGHLITLPLSVLTYCVAPPGSLSAPMRRVRIGLCSVAQSPVAGESRAAVASTCGLRVAIELRRSRVLRPPSPARHVHG